MAEMTLKSALAAIPVTEGYKGSLSRFVGPLAINVFSVGVVSFEVEVATLNVCGEEQLEVSLRNTEPEEHDRDLLYVNTMASNSVCRGVESFLREELGSQVSLAWGDSLSQTSDRFVFSMKEGV